MKKYRSIRAMAEALKKGEIPADVVSPSAAAAALGITRQSLYQRLRCGSVDAWQAEGYILVSEKSLKRAVKEKFGIHETQGELDVATV